MRIGILTLHDSVNYGAVLQAYALRSYLTALGHEAVVIDRRRNPDLTLRTPPFQPRTFRLFGIFPCEARDGLREACVRIARTEEFLLQNVGLTPCRFCDWRDAPADLGLDQPKVDEGQMVSFRCPKCRQEIEASQDMVGEAAQCPSCGTMLVVPRTSEAGTLHSTGPAVDPRQLQAMKSRTMRINMPDDF